MSSAHMHRRPRKIRRTGRHTTPSQVEKVAEAAGKAAPAVAIAGMLVAAPAANAATGSTGRVTTAAVQVHHGARQAAAARGTARQQAARKGTARQWTVRKADRIYTVEYGDTLAKIAERVYDNYQDWPSIYDANRGVIADPNEIYVGEALRIPVVPAGQPAPATPAGHTPQHAPRHARPEPEPTDSGTVLTSAAIPSGTLGCVSLERLWEDGGGSQAQAVTAASIAMAESGGHEFATGSAGERGYWQIHPVHGPLSTYDPLGNARAAVIISDDGTNWSPWTTYTSGAYIGRC